MHGKDVNFDLLRSRWSEIYEGAVQRRSAAAASIQSSLKTSGVILISQLMYEVTKMF